MRGENMKEKPILFSTPMVQALLNTKPNTWPAEPIDPDKPFKSMTRRIPRNYDDVITWQDDAYNVCPRGIGTVQSLQEAFTERCRVSVGDLLWVRETWSTIPYGQCSDGSVNLEYAYKADGSLGNFPKITIGKNLDKWKPSIHMPRKAARLFLEVKSVRVERLQDISDADVKAEGWPKSWGYIDQLIDFVGAYCEVRASTAKRDKEVCPIDFCHDQSCYAAFWNTLNAKRGYSWESNPWVLVYEFMRIEK
jgi:hypothetical protein